MKKIIVMILMLGAFLSLTGCTRKEAIAFKEEYESLNGVVNKSGKEHRTISISENNPFIKTTSNEIVKKIEEDETFYLYVGDPLCPWCRSVLEKAIEVAKNKGIDTIYYIDIWDDEGTEILRDKYELDEKNNLVKTVEGTSDYYKLLDYFDSVLSDYTLTNSDGEKISTDEKRIYAPNFFYIEKGEVKKLTEGISDSQTDARGELTEEMLKDEENQFNEFFDN